MASTSGRSNSAKTPAPAPAQAEADTPEQSVIHPGRTGRQPGPGEGVVGAIDIGYGQTWQPGPYDSLKVEIKFTVEVPGGVVAEEAFDLAVAYTGIAQAAVWEVAIPLLERTGRIPVPSVLSRVAGSDLNVLKWAKDTTGIPVEFRRQLGDKLAKQAKLMRETEEPPVPLDRAYMIENGMGEANWAQHQDWQPPAQQGAQAHGRAA